MAWMKNLWKPTLAATAWIAVVAAVGGALTDTGPWYQALNKPSWQPPDWAFGAVWSVVFTFAVVAAVAAWRGATTPTGRWIVVALFVLNGLLNIAWSALFFTMRNPRWALWEVPFLWFAVLVPMLVFWTRSRTATLALAPYLVWVSIAAYLTFTVVGLNPRIG